MMSNPSWLFDQKLTLQQAKKVLANPDNQRFVDMASLLLKRVNDPQYVWPLLSQEMFVRYWVRIKKIMRRDQWARERVVFWQAVYDKVAATLKANGLVLRSRAQKKAIDPFCVEVGERIRKARLHAGHTQSDLAAAMNVSQQMISQIEKGYENPSILTLKRVADALGQEISFDLI